MTFSITALKCLPLRSPVTSQWPTLVASFCLNPFLSFPSTFPLAYVWVPSTGMVFKLWCVSESSFSSHPWESVQSINVVPWHLSILKSSIVHPDVHKAETLSSFLNPPFVSYFPRWPWSLQWLSLVPGLSPFFQTADLYCHLSTEHFPPKNLICISQSAYSILNLLSTQWPYMLLLGYL